MSLFPFKIFLLSTVLCISSCTQSPLEDCFLSTGPIRTESIPLAKSPVAIAVYDNLNVTWHQSDSFYIQVTCGRNLQNKIEILLEGEKLALRNKARCNWVRDYSKTMQIDLYCNSLSEIELNGFGDFICEDTIKGDFFNLRQYGTCNSKLLLNVGYLNFDFNTYGTSILEGIAKRGFLVTLKEGKLDPTKLKIGTLEVKIRGIQHLHFWVSDTIKGDILDQGTIRYKGNPVIKVSAPFQNQIFPE